jgi:hypothetical protein
VLCIRDPKIISMKIESDIIRRPLDFFFLCTLVVAMTLYAAGSIIPSDVNLVVGWIVARHL